MNVLIITSSYPSHPQDPTGTAGLFVRDFALELMRQGHKVVIQPVARKKHYEPDPGLVIEPLSWQGGDQELASMNVFDIRNIWIFFRFFRNGRQKVLNVAKEYQIDRVLCMWAVPSGIFGLRLKRAMGIPYDVWALGSDIWKIKKIPVLGRWILTKVIKNANGVFADGADLCKDIDYITAVKCRFLPSSRKLPAPQAGLKDLEPSDLCHLRFVGRYHANKGPDLLLEAVNYLPDDVKAKIRLHMFGIGPLETKLKGMVQDFKLQTTVSFNGPIEAQELSNYLERVNFLVIPSRIESIPVIFSDAMQVHTPVISMPVGSLPELIGRFHCGVVASQVTSKSLSDVISQVITQNKSDFKSATEKASDQFQITRTVSDWSAEK